MTAPTDATTAHDTSVRATPAHDVPAGPVDAPDRHAFTDDERAALHRAVAERRDVRTGFRPDPVPDDVLTRVLEAAHRAPSVGLSQPWDFLVVRSTATRQRVHRLVDDARAAYADALPGARQRAFGGLKVEAILDTPLNVVVTHDPTRGGRHVLGRHTQPQTSAYSTVCAVQNLWLAARAEGLGVGWVSFGDAGELADVLGLPAHVEVVAYLCVGYVEEFAPAPALALSGWARRRPLSWAVHEETYGTRALPGGEPVSVLDETLAALTTGEAGPLPWSGTRPGPAGDETPDAPSAVAVFAAEPRTGGTPGGEVTATSHAVAELCAGRGPVAEEAARRGAEVCLVDVGLTGTPPPAVLPRRVREAAPGHANAAPGGGAPMTRDEARRAVETGIEVARDLVAAGNRCLRTGSTGAVATATAADALQEALDGRGDPDAPGAADGVGGVLDTLASGGGPDLGAYAGLVLGAAALGVPLVVDGPEAEVGTLLAQVLAEEAGAAGHAALPGDAAPPEDADTTREVRA